MNRLILIAMMAIAATTAGAQTSAKFDSLTVKYRIRLGSADIRSIVSTINSASTHAQLPTAKAVWTLCQSLLPALTAGTGISISGTSPALTITNTGDTDASNDITTSTTAGGDLSGTYPNPVVDGLQNRPLASTAPASSQAITWTGSTWEPSWGNPLVYTTTGATITTASNIVLIGTITADITLGLPTCNATNHEKVFEIKKNGSDTFGVTVDPNGSETFSDGAANKTIYNQLSLNCVCRFSGGTGVWFFTNM